MNDPVKGFYLQNTKPTKVDSTAVTLTFWCSNGSNQVQSTLSYTVVAATPVTAAWGAQDKYVSSATA